MDASDLNLTDFLGQRKTKFVIPVYQRNYDWGIEHCKQLFDDILECGRDSSIKAHFIGSIVYIHEDIYTTSRVKELVIIDGQQRLTTITLLYLVIYKLLQQIGDQDLVEEIYESYLVNKRDEEKLKLRPTENNDKALRYIIDGEKNSEYREYSRLIENFNYFESRMSEENIDVVLEGLNKLMFVEISLERGKDDPQRIFESLNSTGLDLSQADLIRNYILMGLKYEDQAEIYKKYWSSIEKLAKEESTGNSRVSDFIRDYLTIKNKKIPNKQKVYLEFKSSYSLDDLGELRELLADIKRYAKFYSRLLNVSHEEDPELRRRLHTINRLEINVSYPFILQVYDDYKKRIISKDDFIRTLEMVESYVWRRFIVGVPTNALNKVFMRLYEDVDQADYVNSLGRSLVKKKSSQRFPVDTELIAVLKEKDVYAIKSRNRSFLLERLENHDNKEPVHIENNPDITVEHIFPQNPESQWQIELPQEDYKLLSERYLNTLANLTLSGNNGSLGNKIFSQKRDLPEKGYRDSRLYLNRYLASLDQWGKKELEDRFEILSRRFIEIWPYPKVNVDESVDYNEVNIFDAEDPTNKKLEYAIFLDQKLTSERVSDLYVYVLSTLFELEPKRFFVTDLEERINLSKDESILRSAKSINDTYFIESHMSNRDKFQRLKYALSTFELEDELLIKYA